MEKNSNQNELDLDLNTAEPVTPRKEFHKDPKAEGSILDKVGGLFGKKENTQTNQFAVRKEPTFGTTTATPQPQVQSQTTASTQNIVSSAVSNTVNYATSSVYVTGNPLKTKPMENQSLELNTPTAEEIQVEIAEQNITQEENMMSVNNAPITAQTSTVKSEIDTVSPVEIKEEKPEEKDTAVVAPIGIKSSAKNPENWAIMQKLPPKHRRLFIAIAGAVGVLFALWLLKPSNDNIQEIQTNNSNTMPIEFQSLDPNKPLVENTEPPVEMADPTPAQPIHTEEGSVQNTAQNVAQPAVPVLPNNTQNAQANPQSNVQSDAEKARLTEQKAEAEKLVAEKATAEKQAKLAAEKARKAEQQKTELQRAERQKVEQARIAAEKAKQAKTQTNTSKAAPIVDANKSTSSTQAKNTQTGVKTLVVPAGTSLFQVFRNNGLNISDANAMTKANGVGNTLSSFKANDKVQIQVNSQGRVSTMRLSNGATFIRQADGSYKYSK